MDRTGFKQADRKGREHLPQIGLRKQLESTNELRRRLLAGHSGRPAGCDGVPVLAELGCASIFRSGQIAASVRHNSSARVHKT
jgi:hypothetical protein